MIKEKVWKDIDNDPPPEGSAWDVMFRQLAWTMKRSDGAQNFIQVRLKPDGEGEYTFMPETPVDWRPWEGLMTAVVYLLGMSHKSYLEFALSEKEGMAWTWYPTQGGN